MTNEMQPLSSEYHTLLVDVCAIIDGTRQQLATAYTNYQLLMYWSIGTRINQDILGGKRAEYGAQIVPTLSTQLQRQYGDEYEYIRNSQTSVLKASPLPILYSRTHTFSRLQVLKDITANIPSKMHSSTAFSSSSSSWVTDSVSLSDRNEWSSMETTFTSTSSSTTANYIVSSQSTSRPPDFIMNTNRRWNSISVGSTRTSEKKENYHLSDLSSVPKVAKNRLSTSKWTKLAYE